MPRKVTTHAMGSPHELEVRTKALTNHGIDPTIVRALAGFGAPVRVRSRFSGRAGLAYVDDPHVWVEGPGVAGWYRRSVLDQDFIVEEQAVEVQTDGT